MAPPSWLKETPLRLDTIARHHGPPLAVYLPAINDRGDTEQLPLHQYDFDIPEKSSSKEPIFDKEYQWASLAQESGIYHSQQPVFPRSLLWKIVSGATLTIHTIDSVRPKSTPRNQPCAAIYLRFPVKLRPNCIGFSEGLNAVLVFALTEDCVLYIISLTEEDLSGTNKRAEAIVENSRFHRPFFLRVKFGQGKLALELPHFMYVLPNSETIIFAMQDGSIHQYDTSSNLPPKECRINCRLFRCTVYRRRDASKGSQNLDPNMVWTEPLLSRTPRPLSRRIHKTFSSIHPLRRSTTAHLVP
jgi:hypothetical protein